MKKSVFICAIFLVLLLVLSGTAAAAAPTEKVRVFIGFKQHPGSPEENIIQGFGGNIKYTYRIMPAMAAYIPKTAIQGLLRNPNVTFIEPDVTIHAIDAELSNSWGVAHIGAGAVHDSGNEGAGVKVAIIDTGIDYNNPEFAGRYAGGYDFVNGDNDPMDDNGHGTHVAGIIAAADDGSGVVGVAPEAQIYALKVLDKNGSGSFFDVIAALDWICGNYGSSPKAYITNNSYGSDVYPGSLVQQAFDFADALWGVLNIAAAGNSGTSGGTGNNVGYPARFSSVVAVAATDRNDQRAYFSSTGPDVELSAPGVAITSTVLNGGYESWSGTSMASPHVAGTAALVIASGIKDANNNGFINDDVRLRLDTTATDLGNASWYGHGLVNAAQATFNPTLAVSTTSLANGDTGVAYLQTMIASGGKPPYTWSIAAGSLPDGLSLGPSTGVISGTPTTVATYDFAARVTDAALATATKTLSIKINPALTITTTSLADGNVGIAYSQALSASGGNGTYTWSISAGALPAGLQLTSSTGVISGKPTTTGTYNFTARVADGIGAATQALSIKISPALTNITVTSPNGGEVWAIGSRHAITWTSVGVSGYVRIQLSRDGGTTWTTIISSARNNGSRTWKVTRPATTKALIRIVSISNPAIFDLSDTAFTIK